MTASLGGVLGGGGIKQKGKRTHGQQCADCWGERGIRGLNGHGKNIIKINLKKKTKEKGRARSYVSPDLQACAFVVLFAQNDLFQSLCMPDSFLPSGFQLT